MNDLQSVENTLLSIAIPTYNRAKYLEETLNALLLQVEPFSIPIVISDNCSTDNTTEIVEKFKKQYPHVLYSINEENLGFDQNVLKVVNLCKSTYCWLFSDDDMLENGAVAYIMNCLDVSFDFVFMSYNCCVFDLSTKNEQKVEQKHFDDFRIYESSQSNEFFKNSFSSCVYFGACIIKRELWNQVDVSQYIEGKGFVFLGLIFDYIYNRRVLFIEKPLINVRLGNSSWTKTYYETWYVNYNKIIKQLNIYSEDVRLTQFRNLNDQTIFKLLAHRAVGSLDLIVFRSVFNTSTDIHLAKKIIVAIISILPQGIIKQMYLCYLNVLKPKNYKVSLCAMSNKYLKA